jgi:hypothetical protein
MIAAAALLVLEIIKSRNPQSFGWLMPISTKNGILLLRDNTDAHFPLLGSDEESSLALKLIEPNVL